MPCGLQPTTPRHRVRQGLRRSATSGSRAHHAQRFPVVQAPIAPRAARESGVRRSMQRCRMRSAMHQTKHQAIRQHQAIQSWRCPAHAIPAQRQLSASHGAIAPRGSHRGLAYWPWHPSCRRAHRRYAAHVAPRHQACPHRSAQIRGDARIPPLMHRAQRSDARAQYASIPTQAQARQFPGQHCAPTLEPAAPATPPLASAALPWIGSGAAPSACAGRYADAVNARSACQSSCRHAMASANTALLAYSI